MSRLGFWLAWLLVGSAQAAPVWTLEPALQGWTREGRETELRLRVRAEQAQQVRFELQRTNRTKYKAEKKRKEGRKQENTVKRI